MNNLITILNKFFIKNTFDKKLSDKIKKFNTSYISKNKDYLEFFSGNLIGTVSIRFTDIDVLNFFSIFDIEFEDIKKEIFEYTSINPLFHSNNNDSDTVSVFKISGDAFNIVIFYLLYRFKTSDKLNEKERKQSAKLCADIFNIRTIAILISSYFTFNTDYEICVMAYSNLTNKFLIKKLGSWHKVIDYRSESMVSDDSVYSSVINSFEPETRLINFINDSQSSIKRMMLGYYSEIVKTKKDNNRLKISGQFKKSSEGELVLKDLFSNVDTTINNLMSAINDENVFINEDVINVIVDICSNVNDNNIRSVLFWMHDSYNSSKYNALIDKTIKTIIIYTNYIEENDLTDINKKDYPSLLIQMKGKVSSSRSVDEDLLLIKENLSIIIPEAKNNKSSSERLIVSTRTAIILYIYLLTKII